VASDPSVDAPRGTALQVVHTTPLIGNPQRAERIVDWQVFKGLVLAVQFVDGTTHTIEGSGVLVAPGVALTANHVIQPHIDALMEGKIVPFCFGITAHGAAIWRIAHVSSVDKTDLCILGLTYTTVLPPDRAFYHATISTRMPAKGELVSMVGFRASEKVFESDLERRRVEVGANLLVSSGNVTQQYPLGRDSVMAPWPSIEVDAPAWGGMSGGPVFDSRGFLVGLVTASFNSPVEPAPMLSSLIWPSLGRRFIGGWPVLNVNKSLLELPPALCPIEGRGALGVTYAEDSSSRTEYKPWT
jgi:Trypsin-like peptidase domain